MFILNNILIILTIIAYSWSRYLNYLIQYAPVNTPSFIQEQRSNSLLLSSIVSLVFTISIIINSIFFLDINAFKVILSIIFIALSIHKLAEFYVTFRTYNDLKKVKKEIEETTFTVVRMFDNGKSKKLIESEIEIYIKTYHPNYFTIVKDMNDISGALYSSAFFSIIWLVLFFFINSSLVGLK
ncbi:MAG: hypothetical protein ACE364_01145 [Chlorobiota bacterium]